MSKDHLRESIERCYDLLEGFDMDEPEGVKGSKAFSEVLFWAGQARYMRDGMNMYEAKLKELMDEQSFYKFVTEVARKTFRNEVEDMADGEFKRFVMEHWSEIVGGDEDGGLD